MAWHSALHWLWITGLVAIEATAFGYAFAALRNLNPAHPRALSTALSRLAAPSDAFTPLGFET